MAEADFFSQASAVTKPVLSELSDAEKELEVCFSRWELLESGA